MSILEVKNLKFKYTDQDLFNMVNFKLEQKDHIGLVGLNGVGKSTFLNLLSKNIKPDSGEIIWDKNITVGYLDQQAKLDKNQTIVTYLYDVFSDLFKKEEKMEELYESMAYADEKDYDRILNTAASIGEELEEKGFYAFKSKVGNVINGLGIDQDRINDPLTNFSGGQRAKIILGKLLLQEPDVLIMDEPTNFLDVVHVEWLTKYLKAYPKAFIVVSHDISFINDISVNICALENREITRYKGNYDYYVKERDMRMQTYEKTYINQQKQIKKTEEFIKKNIVRASTTKRAQSRRKMLSKMEILAPITTNRKIYLKFPFSRHISDTPIEVKDLVVGYDKPILNPISFSLKKDETFALVGKNGIGKSTIIKTILGELEAFSGEVKISSNVDFLYFSQDSEYDSNSTPFEIIKEDFYDLENKDVRSILAKVGITGDMVNKKMCELSGGEQTRVRLARLTMFKSNLLIMDEPSNNLDKDAKKALCDAINDYEGVVLLVSHEKDFLEGFPHRLIDVEGLSIK
ncbi:MAG: ABC-F family ATP-binding cassette domain-containing protein [Acholeplasmatales bacterium]|nr:ABC-F family ATP-binding cassette domain-containing protein [Acholeplasmatales bacterium]